MKITIKATGLNLTPSIETYIETKLGVLARLVRKFDAEGQPELHVEIARTSRHHRHGDVYRAEGNLRIPKKLLRGSEESDDVRRAIVLLKNTLRLELEKYKEKISPKRTPRA